MTTTPRGTPQHHVLRGLRRRLLTTVVLVVTLGVGSACVVLVTRDVQLSRARADSDLVGAASRAAALVYVDDAGTPQVDAVADDDVVLGDLRVTVTGRAPGSPSSTVVLYDSAGRTGMVERSLAPLVARAARDAAEDGSLADLDTAEGARRAAAMPWFDEAGVAGVAVVSEQEARPLTSPLLVPILAAGSGLLVLFVGLGWVLTARSLRPAVEAAADRERFLATAAHELKTPLAQLRGAAETLGAGQPPGSPGWAAARRVLHDADGASAVVGNLLLAARIDNAEVPVVHRPVRLDSLASDLELRFPDVVADVHERVVVTGDEALLGHALANLVDNARRHGGHLDDGDVVRVEVRRTGGQAVVRVVDRGPGLPEGVDVRRPYVGTGVGSGLGLSLVEWVAEHHGGRLELGSGEDGVGAVVGIVLPAATPLAPH